MVALALIVAFAGFSQSTRSGAANGMTLNGSTGLIVVPDARVGWENTQIGLDLVYGFVWSGTQQFDHIPRFALSLFRRLELSGALQIGDDSLENFILGTKFQLFKDSGAAMALGGDIEFSNEDRFGPDSNSAKIYLAVTYGGNFFSMPAVTTATIGWQLLEAGDFSSQFVYGMGFSMNLFPKVFRDYVYWITDFSNFSYSVLGANVYANLRGAFNTGIRIHPVKSGKFNLVIDVVGTDLLDNNQRGLSTTISGGMAF